MSDITLVDLISDYERAALSFKNHVHSEITDASDIAGWTIELKRQWSSVDYARRIYGIAYFEGLQAAMLWKLSQP